jgi:hypothetical protein
VSSACLTVIFALVGTTVFTDVPIVRFFMESLLRVEEIPHSGVLMLPLAYSLGSLLNLFLLLYFFVRSHPHFFARVRMTILHVFAASVIMGSLVYHTLNFLDDFLALDTFSGIFLQGVLAALAGAIAHIFLLRLLGNAEIAEIGLSMKNRFWNERPIAPEQESI